MTEVRVVVGPLGGSGVAEAIAAVPGTRTEIVTEMDRVPVALSGAEVLVTYRWDDSWVQPGLRWIQSVSAGTEQFPLHLLEANGTALTSARGIHESQVAEHALGLLLAMTRGIAESVRRQSAAAWKWPRVFDLEGMTLGVLGLGTIGEGIARRSKALGMRVIGTKRVPDGYEGVADEVHPPQGTLEVCRSADAVIVALPGTADTKGLIAGKELEALRNGWLVNVGRGSVVDEAALVTSLEQGGLRGAALDVFEEEPLPPESPLWSLDRLIITPHVAGASPKYGERLAALFRTNLAAHRGEGDWVNRVV